MEERRAIALAKRHRAQFEPRDTDGTEGLAVERRVLAGPGKGRHHIAEGAERSSPCVQYTAGKSGRGKTAARGFQ